jgi:hypothetical protein
VQKIDSASAAASAEDAPALLGAKKRKESDRNVSSQEDGALDVATRNVISSLQENTKKSRISFLQQIIFDTKCHMEELQDKIDDNDQHRSVPRWRSAVEDDKKQLEMYEHELNILRDE